MSNQSLKIPENILFDTSLTPTQKMILSLLGKNKKLFLLDIAKQLGTKRSVIKDDIQALLDNGRLFTSNGTGRLMYSTVKGFNYKANPTTEATKRYITEGNISQYKLNNNNKSFIERSEIKLIVAVEDKANLAFKYWVESGGVNHRDGSGIFKESIRVLINLFDGKAFTNVPDSVIPNPILNKKRKFDLEDWFTSLDNYQIALESPAHYPLNKQKALNYRKKLALPSFIYNRFGKEGSTRSMFLKYLDRPKLVHTEISNYKNLEKSITISFLKSSLRLKPYEAQIIAITNIYGDIIKRYEWKIDSFATAARVLLEFIEEKYGNRFNPNWMTAKWFKFDLENYLDRKGLITIRD